MEISFLGTGAGEGYPAHWCECPHCTYARAHGGRNIRGNTTALIDGEMLIDLSHSAPMVAAMNGISLAGVRTLLVTHAHEDHLYPAHLSWRYGNENHDRMAFGEMIRHGGSRHTAIPELTVCGNSFVQEKLNPLLNSGTNQHMRFEMITPGQTKEINGYTVTAIRGNHVNPEYTNHYIISHAGKTLLYATDTGNYDDESLHAVLSVRYDAVVMECTAGINPNGAGSGHMSLDKNRYILLQMRERHCIQSDTPFVLTHMSPHWTPPYDWFVTIAEAEGMQVAYDGYTMEI